MNSIHGTGTEDKVSLRTMTAVSSRLEAAVTTSPSQKLAKSLDEWRDLLSPEQYAVLFEEATERPFTHELDGEKRPGTFLCAACQLPLFTSDAKFDSRTGWPSFTQAIEGNVEVRRDFKLILPRSEYHCRRCGGHQGHVFSDGPQPTGQRWCNNGLALQFVPEDDPLPGIRE